MGTDQIEGPKGIKSASGPSEKPKGSIAGSEDLERPYLHTPTSSERTESPIVQEPEDHHFHHEEPLARKNSLVIVESTDEHPETLERYEEELLEKVSSHITWMCKVVPTVISAFPLK